MAGIGPVAVLSAPLLRPTMSVALSEPKAISSCCPRRCLLSDCSVPVTALNTDSSGDQQAEHKILLSWSWHISEKKHEKRKEEGKAVDTSWGQKSRDGRFEG